MPALMALFRAHLLLRGHHEAAPGRGQEVPDHGSHVEEDHGQRCSGPKGDAWPSIYIHASNREISMYEYIHTSTYHKYLYVSVIIIDAYTLGCGWEHFNAF